jgi:hypothetical protein
VKENTSPRLIAFYLPQYHPIPENDKWWGKGFTEWTNVAKAKPLFKGHNQPNIPSDLGFYDLRIPEVRTLQADLARKHGIEGFCYWHYWFGNGRQLLERPFTEVVKSGRPNFPFCLGWANDSWSGIWHGCPDRILIEQKYPGRKDEEMHFYTLLDSFHDDRYIKINEKPVFFIYKPHKLPEPNRFLDHWRELSIKSGLKGVFFIGNSEFSSWNLKENGFDAFVFHSPGIVFQRLSRRPIYSAKKRLKNLIKRNPYGLYNQPLKPIVYSYEDFIKHATPDLHQGFMQFPCVIPNWDNTPRSGINGIVLKNSTPELFRIHLKNAIKQVADRYFDKRIVFLKSWNEWAEGNYLEPDQRYGRAYLEIVRDEVFASNKFSTE